MTPASRKDCPHRGLRHFGLRRNLFVWFGAAMVLSAALVALVMHALLPANQWQQEKQRILSYVGGSIVRDWPDTAKVQTEAKRMETQLGVHLVLTEPDGNSLYRSQGRCRGPTFFVPLRKSNTAVGTAKICVRRASVSGAPMLWIVAIAWFALWVASGFVAHRLSRPIIQITQAVSDFGEGDYTRRVSLRRQQRNEIGTLATNINRMADKIESQINDQRELLAAVSHEVRTPLGHMLALIEIAKDKERIDPAFAKDFEAEVRQANNIVDSLLAHSKLEFGSFNRKNVDVCALAAETLQRFELPLTLLQANTQQPTFLVEPTLLTCAINNLVRNAQEHGGGLKELRITEQSHVLYIETLDGGSGFALEVPSESWFKTPSKTNKRTTGLGLGLPLVHRIALAHGGEVWIRTESGMNTVGFSIRKR